MGKHEGKADVLKAISLSLKGNDRENMAQNIFITLRTLLQLSILISDKTNRMKEAV